MLYICIEKQTKSKYKITVCGAKYKTRPGLTYHFTHTHKEAGGSDNDSRDSRAPHSPSAPPATEYQDSYVTFLNNPATAGEIVGVV